MRKLVLICIAFFWQCYSYSQGSLTTVILTAGDVWGDGTGYQMLLDADANTYGSVIPTTGNLTTAGNASSAIYSQFEYKIPINADGAMNTQNIVYNNRVAIQIPAGVYDWCITNPTPNVCIYIASSQGNVGGRKNDYVFEPNKTYEFVVTLLGEHDAVDVFIEENQSFTITTSVNPENGGTVDGGGIFPKGSHCELQAFANAGYKFVNWTKNGNHYSSSPKLSFIVSGDADFVAHFEEAETFQVTTASDPEVGGITFGGGHYTLNSPCTITAVPNPGYVFYNWTKGQGVVDTLPSHSFVVTSNANYIAHFIQSVNSYTITANAEPAAGGTVTGDGTYNQGTTCTLVASPNDGYEFVNWTKNGMVVAEGMSYSFQVTENAVYIANFTQSIVNYTITTGVDPAVGGTVSGGGTYSQGTTCTLVATPNGGYEFLNWTKDGSVVFDGLCYTFQVTDDGVYIAHFKESINGYSISITANPEEGGMVMGAGLYTPGITISVMATANEGFRFKNWTENGVIQCLSEQYEFVVDRPRTLVCNFEPNPIFTITATADANGSITPQGDIHVEQGSSLTFNIFPNFGAVIKQVLVDGEDIGPVETYTFSNINKNHTIFALFSGWGVGENLDNILRIFPNPANEIVTLEGDGISIVKIYNNFGCVFYDSKASSNNLTIQTSCIPAGNYFVEVDFNDGRKFYHTLVVTH